MRARLLGVILHGAAAFGTLGRAVALPADHYEVRPVPGWVRALESPKSTPAAQEGSSGAQFLLVDRQARLDAPVATIYSHFVVHLTNPTGVSDESTLYIRFDPEKEHLLLHSVTLRRASEAIDELQKGRIEVLRREPGLEEGIIEGVLTFHLVMSDVRVGDTLEYSYSIERREPEWGDRFFLSYPWEWASPVSNSYLRITAHRDAPLFLLQPGGPAPEKTEQSGWQELEWHWHDVPAVRTENGAPSWVRQYRRVDVSQFADWAEVVALALPLFEPAPAGEELKAVVARLRSSTRSDIERMRTVLQFVQDEVRYTGIELGEGAYRPASAATVLHRRWGDCKDKVMLSVVLLRGMGIDAAPALVNTLMREHLQELLPSPGDFDHAIVRVRIAGSTYWVDATSTGQGGSAAHLSQAHYGRALVIAQGTTALTEMPPDLAETPRVTSTSVFDLRDGFDKDAKLSVTTLYRDQAAEGMRRELRGTTVQDLGVSYLNYYKRRYAGVRATAPPQVHDDVGTNELSIEESYRISRAFEPDEEAKSRVFTTEAESVTQWLARPGTLVRTTPLDLPAPRNVVQDITILLPQAIQVEDEDKSIVAPAFRYELHVTHTDKDIHLHYRYQTAADQVPVADLADFLQKRETARADSFFSLTIAGLAPSAESEALGKRLREAAELMRNQAWEKADAAFSEVIGAQEFGDLTPERQHAALYLAGLVAMQRQDVSRGHALLTRSSEMPAADGADWRSRMEAAHTVRDWPDEARALTRIAQRWPRSLEDLDEWQVPVAVHDAPHEASVRYELLKALFDAKYAHAGVETSSWWRDLALLQLERGERDAAAASLAQVVEPFALISIQVDNRFAPLRPALGTRLDVAAAADHTIETARLRVSREPNSLEAVNDLALTLIHMAHPQEALQVVEAVIAQADTPEGRKKYTDYDRQYAWSLDSRSRALMQLGRWDEALAQEQAAVRFGQGRDVGQSINLASLYNRLQRPQEARETLSPLRPENMSPYGEMQHANCQVSAASQLNDKPEAERALAFLRDHQNDAVDAYEDALIMLDREDEAAQLLIARLGDPDRRIDALLTVQNYDVSGPRLPRAEELQRRWRAVVARPDVQASIRKVGKIGSYHLRREL